MVEVLPKPTLVFAGGRPSSNFLPFLIAFFFPPVDRLLCQLSRVIPTQGQIDTRTGGARVNSMHLQLPTRDSLP